MANKVTQKEMFALLSEVVRADVRDTYEVEGKGAITKAQVQDWIAGRVEQLNKKSTGERKPSAAQLENDVRRQAILGALANATEPMSIADIVAAVPELNALNNISHSVAGLLTKPCQNGQVVRYKVKGVTYYALAEADAE